MALRIEVSSWRWYSSNWSFGKLALRTMSSASVVSSGRFSPLVDMAMRSVVPEPEAQLGLQLVQAILDVLARELGRAAV